MERPYSCRSKPVHGIRERSTSTPSLKILLDARLVGRRRVGRSALYFRTPAGNALVVALVVAQSASE
jgi:hypothetical protein